MGKVWTILKNEFITVVTRPSFLITLFLLPVIGFVIMVIVGTVIQNQPNISPSGFVTGNESVKPLGFVDYSGLVKSIPDERKSSLIQLKDEDQARSLVTSGDISSYVIISTDYLFSGQMTEVQKDFNLMGGDSTQSAMNSLMAYNLLGQDPILAERFNAPLIFKTEYTSTTSLRSQAGASQFLVPYLIMILLYIIIITSSSLLLNSITSEKQNRVMEILLTSASPFEMLTGKIIALGLAGLLQMVTWFGSAYILFTLAGQSFSLGAAFNLPPSILFWGLLFFILGYALYASLMAGLGALVPNLREANQATILVIFPLIIPMLFSSSVTAAPNNPLFLALSLIPFTSPVTMISRLAATDVPIWQMVLSATILAGTVLIVLRSVSHLFRAQTLLSGKTFKSVDFIRALIKGV